MTLVDQITHAAESLAPKQRREALAMLRAFRAVEKPISPEKRATRKTLGKARKAIAAAKGMWRDRSDLPADTIEASLELRRRAMRRGANG